MLTPLLPQNPRPGRVTALRNVSFSRSVAIRAGAALSSAPVADQVRIGARGGVPSTGD